MDAAPPDSDDPVTYRRDNWPQPDHLEAGDVFAARDPQIEFGGGEDARAPWRVKDLLQEEQGLVILAESAEDGTAMARSLAQCLAFGTSYLGTRPERTCDVAYVSLYAPSFVPPFRFGKPGHVPRSVRSVVGCPLLDREHDRFEIVLCLRRLAVEVAIFDPVGFEDPHFSTLEWEHHLTRAAEACLSFGVTPVFVVLQDEIPPVDLR